MVNSSLLKTVRFVDTQQWNVKHFFTTEISSKYLLEEIGKHTIHITEKTKLFENSEKEYAILGISNEIGMFDAYTEFGKNINQPYIYVEDGCLAYNPYRVNVGSIGLKTPLLKNEYISPAYVVFKCKETILPEYLYLVLKSGVFNTIIQENTTGSVRQTLSYNKMSTIKIPVPSTIDEQRKLVEKFNIANCNATVVQQYATQIETGIFDYLTQLLGIVETPNRKINSLSTNLLSTVKYSVVDKWGLDFLTVGRVIHNKKFPTRPIGSICDSGSGGTPSRAIDSYYRGNIPWIKTGEILDDVIYDTEEKITQDAIANSSAKIYPKGSIVIAMYGQGLTRGRTAKLGIDATTNQACLVLYNIDTDKVLPDYLWYYLQGEYHRLRALAYGNNQPNLNAGIINNYPIVMPPIKSDNPSEITQTVIVNEIVRRKDEIKKLRTKANELKVEAQRLFEEAVFGEA